MNNGQSGARSDGMKRSCTNMVEDRATGVLPQSRFGTTGKCRVFEMLPGALTAFLATAN